MRIVNDDEGDDQRHRLPAKGGDFPQGDSKSEQCDAHAEHRPRGKLMPARQLLDLAEEIHRHAKQQREQHHRAAIVVGQEGGCSSNNQRGQQAGHDPVTAGGTSVLAAVVSAIPPARRYAWRAPFDASAGGKFSFEGEENGGRGKD